MLFDDSFQKEDLGKIAVKEKANSLKSFSMKNPNLKM